MATIGTTLYTWLNGKPVGTDEYGNRYYQHRFAKKGERRKRWVIYKGVAEASKIPPYWHGWMHYTTDTPPANKQMRYHWQKPHQPNLTGTPYAYMPPGHVLKGGERAPATADYQAWKPE